MANAIYPKFKELCLGAGGDLSTVNIKAALVDSASYTYSAAHEFLTSVPTRIADSPNLTSKTLTDGEFDCVDPVFSAVAAGGPHEYLVFYIDTAVAATSRLICFIDTATGLPVTPNGTDVSVVVGTYVFKI